MRSVIWLILMIFAQNDDDGSFRQVNSGSGDLLGQTLGQKQEVYSGSSDLLGQTLGQSQVCSLQANFEFGIFR